MLEINIKSSVNTIVRLIAAVKKEFNLSASMEKIRFFNLEGIEIDDVEMMQFKTNCLIYMATNGNNLRFIF